ncbi:hypothetical protein EYC58_01500 [Candidatus Saccharibacteria bacterium]|nr:MAG: hypothetical protein EYC58_01500 [Candidatus Saccharibacteria bacterium]
MSHVVVAAGPSLGSPAARRRSAGGGVLVGGHEDRGTSGHVSSFVVRPRPRGLTAPYTDVW